MIIFGLFWPLLKLAPFFEAAEAVSKIGSSFKPFRHKQIQAKFL